MTYTSELNYNELPKAIYSWMIEEHKKSWTGPVNISNKGETNRGATVTCDEGYDPENIFQYRPGTGYWY